MVEKPYLTAVFEIRPTRRKAALLERVRIAADAAFWTVMSEWQDKAFAISEITEASERRTAWFAEQKVVTRELIRLGVAGGLAEPVVQGLTRDVIMAIGSYIQLRVGKQPAEWPKPQADFQPAYEAALDLLATSTTRDQEAAGRDEMGRVGRKPHPRPITLARSRDAMLVRTSTTGPISVVLNVLRASDEHARRANIHAGIEAASGEVINAGHSKTKLVIPIACSKWHEHIFLSGKAVLRSSLVMPRDGKWYLCAQFEMPERHNVATGAKIGVDRGAVHPITIATVGGDGRVMHISDPLGAEIGRDILVTEDKRRIEQRRRGYTSRRYINRTDHALHRLANAVVSEAKQTGAQVVFEDRSRDKASIVRKRPAGMSHGSARPHHVLKRAQLGKLEMLIRYKLNLEGCQKPRSVFGGAVLNICPSCGTRDTKNRKGLAFNCISCGFGEVHTKQVGAVNIARRGLAMVGISQGAKLAPRELEIVQRLRSLDDSGLGPLAAHVAASGFVAARAAAGGANRGLASSTPPAGQNGQPRIQNARKRVLAERGAAFPHDKETKLDSGQKITSKRTRKPST
jgi:hypothetical protein